MHYSDNILYIGPYREFSGMGNASRQYLKALIATGANISVRPIYNQYISYPENEIDLDILRLEKNSSQTYHKVIQHCFPHQFVYNSRFNQHIGIVHLEAMNNIRSLKNSLDMMDTIIVGSSFAKNAVDELKTNCKIHIIPEPIDYNAVKKYREDNPIELVDSNYKFYTISNFTDRKNLPMLLMAFLIFVDHYFDIDLIIKVRTINSINAKEYVEYEFEKIYNIARKQFIKKPTIYIGDSSQKVIYDLHNNNDCYINTSYGESFGYSALEALAFNNNIITTANTGFDDIVDKGCGLSIASELNYCKDKDRIFPIYNSVYQKWYEPRLDDIIHKMFRAITESKKQKQTRITQQNNKINNFSIDTVSKLFNNI